jgi:hypothetical protein
MGVKESTLVSNVDAQPTAFTDVQNLHGRRRTASGSVELATGDLDQDDVVLFAPIPSSASIKELRIASDSLDSGSSVLVDVGLFDEDGNAVDADVYATDVTDFQSAFGFKDFAFEARDIADMGNHAWEDAGVSKDPGGYYYVGILIATAPGTAAAGTVAWDIDYVVD